MHTSSREVAVIIARF